MKIFAVANNYPQHNKEAQPTLYNSDNPVVFTKPDSALLKNNKPFFVPDWTAQTDYEAELVVRIVRQGKTIPERFAHRYYDAVTVGIDFTARDMQRRLSAQGMPWDISKGFDGAAVVGKWISASELAETRTSGIQSLHFRLDINGATVQSGFTGDMLFGVDRLIAYISQYFTLKTGDLLYTGTPAGAGPVRIGDRLTGYVESIKVLEFNCK